jgi:hypothetical protein
MRHICEALDFFQLQFKLFQNILWLLSSGKRVGISAEACSDLSEKRDEPPKCRTFFKKKHLPTKKASAHMLVSFASAILFLVLLHPCYVSSHNWHSAIDCIVSLRKQLSKGILFFLPTSRYSKSQWCSLYLLSAGGLGLSVQALLF